MNTPYGYSFNFTGPLATYTLLGDQERKGSIYPVLPSAEYTERLALQRHSSSRAKAKAKRDAIAREIDGAVRGSEAERLMRMGIKSW